MPTRLRIYILLFLSVCSLSAKAGWPDVPLPPTVKVTHLANSFSYHGIPMDIRVFSSHLSMQRILEYYRNQWHDEYVENQYGPWQQISHKHNKDFITIQIQQDANEHAYGRISIMKIPEQPVKQDYVALGVPLPPGSSVIDDILSSDTNGQSRVLLAHNKQSLKFNSRYYIGHYQHKGWNLVMDNVVSRAGHVLAFQKGNKAIDIVLRTIGNTSYIQLNQTTKKSLF